MQRHILEGAGGAVPKLEDVQRLAVECGIGDGRGIVRTELLGGVRLFYAVADLLGSEVRQKVSKDLLGSSPVILLQKRLKSSLIILGKLLRNKQTAILGDTL